MLKLFTINQIYCYTLPTSPVFFRSELPSSHCPTWDSTCQDQPGWDRGTSVHQPPAQLCSPAHCPGELSISHGPAAVLLVTQPRTHTRPLSPPATTPCLTLINSSAITLPVLDRWAFEMKISAKSLLSKHSIATCSQSQPGFEDILEPRF